MSNLTIIIISLILSAFFSGMEMAFIASNKLRIELDKKQNLLYTRIISIFTLHPGQYITTMLIGNNIALVIYGLVMAKILQPLILSFTSSDLIILVIQTIISTVLILFTAEFLPKTLVIINPNLILKYLSSPVALFYIIFYPLTKSIIWLINLVLKNVFNVHRTDTYYNHKVFGKIDLDHLISESTEDQTDSESEESDIKFFQNALEFSNVKIRDCMLPRAEIIAMEQNNSIDELKQKFIETGFSKILIYKETIDNIIGYFTLKELFKNPSDIKSNLISVSYVPETMAANKLLRRLIQEHKSIAVVVDEFGGISGMVTIEDIIEEIFGEIEDEHDLIELVEKQISDYEFVFSGRLEIDYINDKYNLKIDESEEYETLAGYIFHHHRSIPKINERFVIHDMEFKIIKASNTRIKVVYLQVFKND